MARKKKAKKNRSKGGSKPVVENSNETHDTDEVVDAPKTELETVVKISDESDEHGGSSLTNDEGLQDESRGDVECVASLSDGVGMPPTLKNTIVQEFEGTGDSIEHAANESQPDAGDGVSACGETASTVAEQEAIEPVSDAGLSEDASGHPALEMNGGIVEEKGQRGISVTDHPQDLYVSADDELKDVPTREEAATEIAENAEIHQFSGEECQEEDLAEEVTETSDLVCGTAISSTVGTEHVQCQPEDGYADEDEEEQGPVDMQRNEGGDDTTDGEEEGEGQAGTVQTEDTAETSTVGSIKDSSTIEDIGSSDKNQGTNVERDFSSGQDEFVAPKQRTSFGSQFSRDLSDVDLDSESGSVRRFSSNDDILPLDCDPSSDIEAFRYLTNALRQNLGEDANEFTDLELSQFTRWKPDVKAASGRFREYLKFRRENDYLYKEPLLVSENPQLVMTLRTGFVLAPENLVALDGSAVMIVRAAKCDPSRPECGEREVSRAIFFTLHSIIGRKSLDPVKGLTIILDLEGVTRKNIAKRIPSMLSKASGCLPIRIRSILVVSQPWWFPNHQKLLRQKIRSRVKHLKQRRALGDHIDQNNLLIEDGGNVSFDLKSELSNIILHEVDLKYGQDNNN